MLKNVTQCRRVSDTAAFAVGWSIAVRSLAMMLFWLSVPGLLQADEVSLQAQPRLCVVPVGEQSCSLKLQVSWTSATFRDVCLHLNGQPESLQCWQAQQAGTFSVALTQTQNILIQLLDAENLEVLSEVGIPVITRDLRDTRRRRRHAWSVF